MYLPAHHNVVMDCPVSGICKAVGLNSIDGSHPAAVQGIASVQLQAPASLPSKGDVLAALYLKGGGMHCCPSKPLRPHCRQHSM